MGKRTKQRSIAWRFDQKKICHRFSREYRRRMRAENMRGFAESAVRDHDRMARYT